MIYQFELGRRMERFIEYHAYNGLPVPGSTGSFLNSENSIALGYFIDTQKGREFVKYKKDESGKMVDPKTGKIVKSIDKKVE